MSIGLSIFTLHGEKVWGSTINKVFANTIKINDHLIGEKFPPFIIAEISGNHKGSLEKALAMIDAAAATGADAIKIQTYTADTLTLKHNSSEFCLTEGLWKDRTLYDLYEEAHTPWEWHQALFERAAQHNITLFSSPFDATAVDLLESLNCPAYKIASFEINDIGLIQKVAATGKPLIISTGLAALDEIEEAVSAVKNAGGTQLALLHCISSYPAPIEDCNLLTIKDMATRFGIPVGLSDHTVENTASVAAVALGASIIEKHFTLDRSDGSVDAEFSLEPAEFSVLVVEARKAKKALGVAGYDIKPSEIGGRNFRRSLYVVSDIKSGEQFTQENIRSVRPGLGLHTRYLPEVLGKTATQDLAFGTPVAIEHINTDLNK